MDYKTIAAALPQDQVGLIDYDKMVSDRRAKMQAELASLQESEAMIDYTTPLQLKPAKLAEIEERRGELDQERQTLETNEDFLRRYAGSRRSGLTDPTPTEDRQMEGYIPPAASDLINQPQLSSQKFDRLVTPDSRRFHEDPVIAYPDMSYGEEFLKGIPRGAANMVASMPAIQGALSADANRNAVQALDEAETLLHKLAELKRSGMDEFEFIQQATDLKSSVPQPIQYKVDLAIGAINAGDDPDEVIRKFREEILALPQETKQTGAFQSAERMHKAINEAIPVREEFTDSWTRKLGEGLGSLAPMVGAGLVPGVGLPLATGVGMASQGGGAVEEAVEAGASEDDIRNYGLMGTAIGSLEAVPIGRLLGLHGGVLGRLQKLAPETMGQVSQLIQKMTPAGRRKMAGIVMDVAGQGIEEGFQEAVSQTLLNAAAKITFDEDRALSEGVGEAAALGGIIGSGVRGVQRGGEYLTEDVTSSRGGETLPPTEIVENPIPGTDPGGNSLTVPGETTVGGLEGEIMRDTDVVPRAAPAGSIEGMMIDGELNRNAVTPAMDEPAKKSTEVGGLEGEIIPNENAVTPRERIAGALEAPVVEGEVNRAQVEDTKKLEGSTDGYDVIDDGYDKFMDDMRKTTPSRPAIVTKKEDADIAASDVREPTEAQKEAGNYRKGHAKLDGLDITIETPKGAARTGTDADGNAWSVDMPGHYGYIKRSKGMDGEQVDVTIGDNPQSDKVFVIDQVHADTKKPDEHKVIMGVDSAADAADLYRRSFSDNRGNERMGGMVEMDRGQFKAWLAHGRADRPITQQAMPDQVVDLTTVSGKSGDSVRPAKVTKEEFSGMVKNAKQRSAARATQASELAAEGSSVRLYGKDGRSVLAGPDMSKPGKFRATYFDKEGPSNHVEFDTLEKAIDEGLRNGYRPKDEAAGGSEFTPPSFLTGEKVKGVEVKAPPASEKDFVRDTAYLKEARKRLPKGMVIGRLDPVRPNIWSLRNGANTVLEVDSNRLTNKQIDDFVRAAKKESRNGDDRSGMGQPGSSGKVGGSPDIQPAGKGKVHSAEDARTERGIESKSERRADARERNRGRHPGFVQPFVEEGDGSPKLTLTHFSDRFHDTITPQDGWRTRGAEKGRTGDADYVPRSYFGIGVGKKGGYRKDVEGGAGHVTSIDPDELYDFESDPDNLRKGRNTVSSYERAIKDAGYAGYVTRIGLSGDGGPAAVVFYDAKTESQFDGGLRDRPDEPRAKGLEKSVALGKTGKRLFVGPVKIAKAAKAAYAKASGIRPATTIREYVKVDEDRARRIADEFENMKHDPNDPEVRAAYDAMIRETLAQYQAMLDAGFKAEMIPAGMADPYAQSPRLAIEDIRKNNHMWVFPTDDGFGSSDLDVSGNPLLQETEFKDVNGVTMLANDVFRAVHDYFGHAVEGNGMRARGEEMAWRVHASMYSPLARRAMTTETRGQNSWVNYGPFSERNKTASGSETVYAPQKIGLLPEWASEEGLHDPTHLKNIERARKMAKARVEKRGDAEDLYALAPGFYSALTRGVENAKQKSAQGKDWKAIVSSLPGVRKAEIEWIGVNEWLDAQDGQVSREDLVNFVKANEIEVHENILTGRKRFSGSDEDARFEIEIDEDPEVIDIDEAYLDDSVKDRIESEGGIEEYRQFVADERGDEIEDVSEEDARNYARQLEEYAYYEFPERQGDITVTYADGTSEVSTYTVDDGGSFYWEGNDYSSFSSLRSWVEIHARERASEKGIDPEYSNYGTEYDSYTESGGRNYREILLTIPGLEGKGPNAKAGAEAYGSSHFEKTGNIIVHARTKDRGANGEILFIEEVQSDLGSDIRKEMEDNGGGPPTQEEFQRYNELEKTYKKMNEEVIDREVDIADKFERDYARQQSEESGALRFFLRNLRNGKLPGMERLINLSEEGRDFIQFPYGIDGSKDHLKEWGHYAEWLKENTKEETAALDEAVKRRDDARLRFQEARDPYKWSPSSLPRFPFEGESYYHLAMKRLLRLAVDEGKSAIAWTPAYIQGRRWSQAVQNVVQAITWQPGLTGDGKASEGRSVALRGVNGTDVIAVDGSGVMMSAVGGKISSADVSGKHISDLVGSVVAKQIMEEPSGDLKGQQIVIGGDGYKIAYDRNMKSFMEKFAKRYGSSVTVDDSIIGVDARDISIRAEDIIRNEDVSAKSVLRALTEEGMVDGVALEREADIIYKERIEKEAENRLSIAEKKLADLRREFADITDLNGNLSEFDRGVIENEEKTVAKAKAIYEEVINRRGAAYELNYKAALKLAASGISGNGVTDRAIASLLPAGGDPVWRVNITPQMREAILSGQPFSIGDGTYRLTPDAQNQMDELHAIIDKVAPGLKAKTKIVDRVGENEMALGKYSRDTGAIAITSFALQSGMGKKVFGHEMLHAFVDHGLLSESDIQILQNYAERYNLLGDELKARYTEIYGERGLDPAEFQRLINEEGLAELVGDMISRPDTKIPGELAGVVGRLKRLLERIANAVRGLGFKSASDILEEIRTGEVGSRMADGFTPKDGEALFSLGERKVSNGKKTTADDLGDFMATDNRILRKGRAAQRWLQDKFLSVKLMQRALADTIIDEENAYLMEELSAARIPELTQEMNDEMQDVLMTLHEAKVDRDLFERFLRMRHAKERNENIAKINTKFPDGGSGTRTEVAKKWLAMAKRLMPIDQYQAMVDAADQVYAINKKALRYRLDGGLIDSDYYDELTSQYRYYVPLKGHEFEEDIRPISNNRGYGAKGAGLKQAMGRRSEAQNTLSYIVEDFRRAIYSSERNKVNVALYDFIKNNAKLKAGAIPDAKGQFKNEDFVKNDWIELDPVRYKRVLVKKKGLYQGRKIWVPADFIGNDAKIDAYLKGLEGNASERLRLDISPAHNDLPVMIDGKRHIMRIKNDTLLNDLLDMHVDIERLPYMSAAMSGFTRLLTMWNPAFGPTNFVRDVMSVGLVTGSELGAKESFKIMKDSMTMTRVILNSVRGKTSSNPDVAALQDLYEEMKLHGGSTGFSHVVRDAKTIQKELEIEAEWLSGKRTTGAMMKHGLVSADRFMEKFNRVFEDATRLAAYKARLDAGETDRQALSYAKNVTVNFNKRGHQHMFSALYAFANANFQGNYRMLRALINGKNGGKVLAGLIGGGFLYGLANILMGYDDDEPEKINGWYERNQYDKAFYLMLGPIKLPKPHGFMLPFDLGTKMAELVMAAIDPEHCNPGRRSMGDLTASALLETMGNATAFVPVGTQEDAYLRPVPTMLAPLMSAATNRTPFGGSIYPEGFDRTVPNWKNFYAETPEIYHNAARWMNSLSGGNEFEAGRINVSPEVVEFMVNSYLGGLGGEMRKTASLAMMGIDSALGNETKPLRSEDIPILRRFLPSQRTNSLTDYYYEFSERMQRAKNAKDQGGEAARQYIKDNPVEMGMMKQWEATKKQRSAIRKQLETLDRERRTGDSVGLRRDTLLNKRSLIERRFARSFQINDQIKYLEGMQQTAGVKAAIEKLRRDRTIMSENIAKLISDQNGILQARQVDKRKVGALGDMFK